MTDSLPVPSVNVRLDSNSPHEQGVMIGRTLRAEILCAERIMHQFETFRLQQPWWMPYYVFQYMAMWRARSLMEPRLEDAYPKLTARLRGMAEGAGTSLEFLFLFHALESASTSAAPIAPSLAACSAVAARGKRTVDQLPVLAHNFDLVPSTMPLLTVRESRIPQCFSYVALSLAPMTGVIDGINEAGLAITYNYAPTTDSIDGGSPVSMSIDWALSNCGTVEQAAERLAASPRGGGALLMLADASGDIASLELSAHHAQLRRPTGALEWLVHSNAYQTEAMQKYELPRSMVYDQSAPQALRGVPVFESAEKRQQQMERLLLDSEPLDVDSLEKLLSDHGPHDQPSGNSICMHGPHWSTLASVQLFPAQRRLRVSYGHACRASFEDFQL